MKFFIFLSYKHFSGKDFCHENDKIVLFLDNNIHITYTQDKYIEYDKKKKINERNKNPNTK